MIICLRTPIQIENLGEGELENDIVKEAIFALKSSQPEWKDLKKYRGRTIS